MDTDSLNGESIPGNIFTNAADTLLGLHMIPEAGHAAAALRHALGSGGSPSDMESLSDSLRHVYGWLIIESSPDYWLEQVAGASSEVDADTVEMTAAVAYERQMQAQLIANVLDEIENGNTLLGSSRRDIVVGGR